MMDALFAPNASFSPVQQLDIEVEGAATCSLLHAGLPALRLVDPFFGRQPVPSPFGATNYNRIEITA